MKKNKKYEYAIDGRQLMGMMGGVQRYISEILTELDKIAPKGLIQVVIPKEGECTFEFENLEIVRYGKLKGLLWEQIDFPAYLIKNKKYGIFMCTVVSMLYPKGIAVIHDVMPAKFPDIAKQMGSFFARNMLLLNYYIAAKFSTKLVTVSKQSARDIEEIYGRSADSITIIGNAWQHILRQESDDSWRERFPNIKKGEYFFTLSANRKQKNFKWIYEVAKRNPDKLFLMAGTVEEWQRNEKAEKADNIIQLGFVSDAEVKSLMSGCKAFLFPSFYEGFGIPPMEALACGAKIVIARASCLPEIYQDSAYYIDPYDYEVDLDKLLETNVASPNDCLSRFGWDKSAEKLLSLIQE